MNISAHEVQFHMLRLGRREYVARLFGVSKETLNKVCPRTELERYTSGELVNIGGVLARKCVSCSTAKPLDEFVSKSSNLSGCGNTCSSCRRAKRMHSMYLKVRRTP